MRLRLHSYWKHGRPPGGRVSALLLWLLIPYVALGQATIPLSEALKKLNGKRGVFFLYTPQVVEGRRVTAPTDWNHRPDVLLGQWLQGTGLTYRKVGECYLIEPDAHSSAKSASANKPLRRFTLSGYVREQSTGEQLAGVTVYVVGKTGTLTNNYGYFALTLPEAADLDLIVSLVGYQRSYYSIRLDRDQRLTVELKANEALSEVVLTAEAGQRGAGTTQTSQHSPTLTTLRSTPAVGGEKDVFKALQLLPGIQKGLDGQVGLFVRGGGADQNLVILDEAPVYNANHLFGFVSAFNTDALQSVTVQKGGFSARYGGRLSSVVDMRMQEGNRQRVEGELSTGLVASRLRLEGPILRNRASFHLTARRSNFDGMLGRFVAGLVDASSRADWRANFYDLNAKVNAQLNARNQIYLSGYLSGDRFGGGDSMSVARRWENHIGWGNATGTLRWNHLFTERLFSNLSLVYSQYNFATTFENLPNGAQGVVGSDSLRRQYNRLADYCLKYDLDYFPYANHHVRAGLAVNRRLFWLNGYQVKTADARPDEQHIDQVQTLETALYAEDEWAISERLRLTLGGRLTRYAPNGQSFWRMEPRLSAALKLTDWLALRGSYAEMNQFIHQLTNTGQGLPTDLWVPANARVQPQRSRQGVLALVADIAPRWQLSVEGYQKQMSHIIGYHPNADFIGITSARDAQSLSWERNVTSGVGDATGVELLLQRRTGRLSGWLAYTWAVTRWQFGELNNGRAFYPLQDRRHTFAWNGTFALSPRLRLSGSWQFSTGNPQSVALLNIPTYTHLGLGKDVLPTGTSQPPFGTPGPLLAGRQSVNSFRAESSHQLNVAVQQTFRTGRLTHRVDLTVTNVYARRNPFYYEYHPTTDAVSGLKRVSLFVFLPALNYSLQF